MHQLLRLALRLAGSSALLLCAANTHSGIFRVATYNVAGYSDESTQGRKAKSPESKAKVRESILAMRPDVIALQEVGGTGALLELRGSLKAAGLDFPHWELVSGTDTNIHLAVLSRFPFTARRPHTNDVYLLSGRRFRVGRGFAEVDIQVNPGYAFTLFTAHLKSKRPVPMADEAEQRLHEARLLRLHIETRLAVNPEANLIVLGDLNDTPDAASTKLVIGHSKNALLDTRPAERHLEPGNIGRLDKPDVAWTYHYAKEDTYSRVDYLLLSRGMLREWLANENYVLTVSGWAEASDHRPVLAAFETSEK